MRESREKKKQRAENILGKLRRAYPDAKCALDYSNPLELMVATILSAQCTDKRVNLVTPALFKKYPDVSAYAAADPRELERLIQSTGFYKNKARSIQGAARRIEACFAGKVPQTLEELVTLPGVGRKTANVILGNAFGIPGLTVDTHMIRLNNRLGLTSQKDPVKIEFELMKLIPAESWTEYSHLIISHGRNRCIARKPDCKACEIRTLCPSAA